MHKLAGSLSTGRGFTLAGERIFNQSVGYPAFLSVFYRVFGPSVYVAVAVNIILGVLSVALVYFLARRLFDGVDSGREMASSRAIALTAGLLAAIYPDSLMYSAIVSSENLLIPLMLLLLLAVTAMSISKTTSGILAGLFAAFAASVKAYVLVFCIFQPLIWRRFTGEFVKQTLVAALVGVICLTPWALLNYRASNCRFVPFSAISGTALLDGTNPEATGKPSLNVHLDPEIEAKHDAIEINKLKIRKVLSYIRNDPVWFARLTLKKLLFSVLPTRDFMFEFEGQARFFTPFLSRWGTTAFNGVLLIGTALGLWYTRRHGRLFVVGGSLVAASILLQLVFFAYPRYRFPFLLCLLPFCSAGLLWSRDVLRKVIQNRGGDKESPI